jgi:hypothetical protein
VLIVFAGLVGQSGLGGQAWATMNYLAGLRALGHDVVYLEDFGDWLSVYDWEAETQTTSIDYPAAYVADCMAAIELDSRWIVRAGDDARGMDVEEFVEFCDRADLLVMRAAPLSRWRPEYDGPARRVFIDVDPGFTQVRIAADSRYAAWVRRCDRFFTVGLNVGRPGCLVPTVGIEWRHTLPPVALAHWPLATSDAAAFTTIMRWRGFVDAEHEGVEYGQKDREFPRYIDLPARTSQPFLLALMGAEPALLERHGWHVVPSWSVSRSPQQYRSFITGSRAEFGVPKHGYVATGTGWFSDRSVCYLAAGRPVLVGDTGLHDVLPQGCGLVTFSDVDEAAAGVEAINRDYRAHCRGARRLAEEFFAAAKVLPAFLDGAMDTL